MMLPVQQFGKRNSSEPRFSMSRKLGYGVGDFGFNLFFTTASLYLLYYYTDVLGLSPSAAGWVFAAALIWDAAFDPVMGYLANRTRSRWGRYRPYLLFGAIPLAASWMLIFLPTGLEGTALLMFAIAAHVLFRTMYAVVNMPYLALGSVITSDSNERGVLAGVRMLFAASCGLFAAFSTLRLVELFGGGQSGFLVTAALFGSIACVALFIVFASTNEVATSAAETESHPSINDIVLMLRSNTAFWLISGGMLGASIAGTMFNKTLPYYFKYALDREDLIGTALTVLTGAVMLSIPMWTWVMKRSSKRTMWLSGLVIAICVYPTLYFGPETTAFWLPLLALAGVGAGASYLGFWSTVPDTVEFGEWRTGVRAEGALFGVVVLIQKSALGLSAAALGEMLSRVGYSANIAQTPQTLAAMKLLMLGVPLVAMLIAGAFVACYPIDQQLHRQLRIGIARRRRT